MREFDPQRWSEDWNMSRLESAKALWQRMEERRATA